MPAKSPYNSILRSLVEKELVVPYLKAAVLNRNWPDEYHIKVDSRPYYGLGDGYFHPSTHPLLGARRLYYEFHPETRHKLVWEERDVQDEMTLAMGSALHSVVQTQFKQVGILRCECTGAVHTCRAIEVEYVIKEHHVRGRADMVIDHPNGGLLPVEFKTQNVRAFNFQDDIKPEWDAQLSLALYGLGHTLGVLLVMEAGFPYRMKEFRVPRNDRLLSEIFAKFDHVREAIALNHPPEHCCGKGTDDMKKCPARFVCWLANRVDKVSVTDG